MMTSRLIVTACVLAAACAKTPAKSPAPHCVPIAEANARATAAAQRNQQRFEDQLARKGLELVALPSAGVDQGEQNDVTAETREIGGAAKRVLVVPSYTCATGSIQLARNAQHELYVLAIHKRATNASISACGCRPDPGAAPGCGGAHVAPIRELYVLPDELTYKGSIDIDYEVEPDTVLFSGRRPDGGDCPRPSDPPP